MDFQSDTTSDGSIMTMLNVIDNLTREACGRG